MAYWSQIDTTKKLTFKICAMRGPSVQQNMQGVIYGSTYLGHEKQLYYLQRVFLFSKAQTRIQMKFLNHTKFQKSSWCIECFKNAHWFFFFYFFFKKNKRYVWKRTYVLHWSQFLAHIGWKPDNCLSSSGWLRTSASNLESNY